ncbi:hypothetical protein [Microcoleus sp. bin38.metabat.b11b12b14.051]|uniref:hypothetical protein n=1 Tax=Microcoleus sp. bin38.metabat.b11b12b14.051 TaxID=2742709 RepID=UPI0025FABF25|nr:hypothetical protein [Microcoleus sp. bin38.metabat.b11b12b14.051]
MTIGVLLGVVLAMVSAIWFVILSPAPQNLELKADGLTQSISKCERRNLQVWPSVSQNSSTASMNPSQQLPLRRKASTAATGTDTLSQLTI